MQKQEIVREKKNVAEKARRAEERLTVEIPTEIRAATDIHFPGQKCYTLDA